MDIDEVVARAEIADVLARYARGVDRADWDLVRRCYHPDATDDHGLYHGGVDGLITFLSDLSTKLVSTTHQLGNFVCELAGDVARTETYCVGWYHRSKRQGQQLVITQGVRYLDVHERRHGRWAILSRTVVLDWEQVSEATGTTPPETWRRGFRGASDPSYAHLTSP